MTTGTTSTRRSRAARAADKVPATRVPADSTGQATGSQDGDPVQSDVMFAMIADAIMAELKSHVSAERGTRGYYWQAQVGDYRCQAAIWVFKSQGARFKVNGSLDDARKILSRMAMKMRPQTFRSGKQGYRLSLNFPFAGQNSSASVQAVYSPPKDGSMAQAERDALLAEILA